MLKHLFAFVVSALIVASCGSEPNPLFASWKPAGATRAGSLLKIEPNQMTLEEVTATGDKVSIILPSTAIGNEIIIQAGTPRALLTARGLTTEVPLPPATANTAKPGTRLKYRFEGDRLIITMPDRSEAKFVK